jgi:preprotein translocase subunit YajC
LSSLAALIAQAAPPSPLGGSGGMFVMMAIMFAIFYFMMIRPQRKQEDALKKFIDGLQKGDEVVTTGGMVGKVDKLQDGVVTLEVANGVRVRVMKSQIVGPFAPVADSATKTESVAEKK